MSATITKQQIVACVETVKALAEAIRELGTVSDGTLYASLMGQMSLDHYQYFIGVLVDAGIVTNYNHQLVWKGRQSC